MAGKTLTHTDRPTAQLVVFPAVQVIRTRLVETVEIRCLDCPAVLVVTLSTRRLPGLVRALERVHRCAS